MVNFLRQSTPIFPSLASLAISGQPITFSSSSSLSKGPFRGEVILLLA